MRARLSLIVSFVASVSLGGCFIADWFRPKTAVSFTVDLEAALASSRKLGSGLSPRDLAATEAPNELLWVDTADGSGALMRATLVNGANEVELAKGSVHLIGFAYNPSLAGSSGPIRTVGNVRISAAGLDTIPLSEEAADALGLGSLTLNADGYASGLGLDAAEVGLGFDGDTLAAFGEFDNSLMKLLNPDIDGDGEYDAEQGLVWKFRVLPYVNLKKGDYDFGSSYIDPNHVFELDDFQYLFDLPTLSGYPIREDGSSAYGDISMTLTREDGTQRSFISTWVNTGQVYFRPADGDRSNLPEDGAYDISLPKAPTPSFSIDRAVFLKQAEGFAGLPFPIIEIAVNDAGRTTAIAWTWMVRDGGSYRRATDDEVRVRVRSMHFSWELVGSPGDPVIFQPKPYYASGDADLSGWAYSSLVAEDIQCMFVDFVDLGWNYYKFNHYSAGDEGGYGVRE